MKSEKEQEAINSKELIAWNEWKVVCSIRKCSEPNCNILSDRVKIAFKNKLQAIDCEDYIPEDCASEFDMGIIEKAEFAKTRKNYKDHTWSRIEESDDPPLKVIRGQLTGKLGIINEIAERYLRMAYPSVWENSVRGHKTESLDKPVEGEQGEDNNALVDRICDEGITLFNESVSEIDRIEIQKYFLPRLTKEDAAVLLVYLSEFACGRKLSLAEPELLAYTGFSKTKCYDRYNNVLEPMLKEACEIINSHGCVALLFSILKNYIASEKSAAKLLSKLEEA